MRDIYHDNLDEIGRTLIEMTHAVGGEMLRATSALLDADLAGAEWVISEDLKVDAMREHLEARIFQIIAQQQPVATDLRVIISSLRMGDLALHGAKIARMRFPEIAVPPELRDVISQMGAVAQSLVEKVGEVIEGRDVSLAQAIETEDDSMDALHRKLFTLLLSPHWSYGMEGAIDMTLLGRYYERYADHAVAVARRVVFIVTGQKPDPIPTGYTLT